MCALPQDEDLSLSLGQLLRTARGRATVAFELLALVRPAASQAACAAAAHCSRRQPCLRSARYAHGPPQLPFAAAVAAIGLLHALTPVPTRHGQVGMAPFLLLEAGSLLAWGPRLWLDAWNTLDTCTYGIQARLADLPPGSP